MRTEDVTPDMYAMEAGSSDLSEALLMREEFDPIGYKTDMKKKRGEGEG